MLAIAWWVVVQIQFAIALGKVSVNLIFPNRLAADKPTEAEKITRGNLFRFNRSCLLPPLLIDDTNLFLT
jgi:hypothetical protein